MAQIIIRKGHDIQIAGVPKKEVAIPLQPISIALHPTEFKYIKPKLLIKEGDHVKIGSPLFYDKCNPDIRWASPATGDIAAVHYGPRRSIQKILIKLDKHEESLEFKRFDSEAILSSSREIIIDHILSAGLWPVIRQRPFNKVANPKETPSSIFISCVNSAPLTADLDLVMRNKQATFHAGINALSRITDGQVNVVVGDTSTSETFMDIPHAETHSITGPHPAGNVGIQIHHIDPLKPGKLIWTVDAQFVLTLGTLFLKGVFDPGIVVAVGGPGVKNPIHFQSRIGAAVKSLVKDRLKDGNYRLISGDVLTGETIDWDDHLHFYHTCVSIIPESDKREFLGFLRPGSSKTRYSLTNAFCSFRRLSFPFTTLQNGEERAMVPINSWENVLPMDILPNALYRSILANDIEEMEKLGLLECDEEDFALCSFADASKINVGAVIRQGLDTLEAEGQL